MNTQLTTEDPRYSLKTLQALYYGATYGSAQGILRITFTDSICGVNEGNVLSVGSSGIFTRTDDGTLKTDVEPVRILHAEVI